jgi:hypothetical protein
MGISDKLHGHLDQLIEDGKKLPRTTNALSQNVIAQSALATWQIKAAAVVNAILPEQHSLRRLLQGVGHAGPLVSNVEHYIGALAGLSESIRLGLLEELVQSIREEVSADDLNLAEALLNDETNDGVTYIPAAVLAGATLERTLRQRCIASGLEINKANGERKALNALIDALRAANLISELRAKQMRGWAHIRNDAAHGDFDKFNRADVGGMIRDMPAVLAEMR